MIKAIRVLRLCVLLLLPLFFGACKNDLVRETSHDYNEKKNIADYEDFILPPKTVTASHGQKKCVTLSWEPVKNAIQYHIYSAETPYSSFSKISETKEAETEIIIDEESGITKYYCVCAVNYFGTVSSKSMVVKGSTLAVPVITSIESSERGDSVTLNWWMDNCIAETYADLVTFNINVYAVNAPSIKARELTAGGLSRQISIDNLTSKTEYLFEVEVINNETQEKEAGGKTSAETARNVIPQAPEVFAAAQGVEPDKIELKWTLPQGCWYRENSGTSGFVLHPLYFNIYRKLSLEGDDKYRLIAKTFVQANDEWKNRKTLGDGCFEISAADSDKKLDTPYGSYVQEAEVVWNDETAERGKKYTYYIQSATDDVPQGKIITSDSSKTDAAEGWLISIPTFSIDYKPQQTEAGDAFEKINCSFIVDFEPFGKEYNYIIVRKKFEIDNPETEIEAATKQWSFNSIEAVNAFSDAFDSPAASQGYYSYSFYVCQPDNTDISLATQSTAAPGKYLVTDDVNAVPQIEDFKLVDGFSNHFELSWKYKAEYTYTIKWNDVVNGVSSAEESYTIPSSYFEGKNNGDVVIFEHEADSGDQRKYRLQASSGLVETFRPNNDTGDVIYQTLGTAQPQIDSYEYDKICVSWPIVQKAKEDYIVSAKYEGQNEELVTSENLSITTEGSGPDAVYKCIIDKPEGYNDATISGKNIRLTVTATSQNIQITTDNQTTAQIDVCTVGPAMTATEIGTKKYSDQIDVTWKSVKGASGYIIRRIIYKTQSANPDTVLVADIDNTNTDCYYFDGTNLTIMETDSAVSADRAAVQINENVFTLTDKYKEPEDDLSLYEKNQSCIGWGIPFGYIVIPVRKNGSKNDFDFSQKDVNFAQTQTYENLEEVYGASEGYGLAVHAKKSESSNIQKIEWNIPYNQNKKPVVYYRPANSTDNLWKNLNLKESDFAQIANGKQTASFTPENAFDAYEYLVAYNVTAKNLSNVPASFLRDTNLGLSKTDSVYTYNENVQIEKSNKGYLLAVDYSAESGNSYSEDVIWDEWNYDERSLGPDKAYVRIRNYNLSSDWVKVAELDKNLHFVSQIACENTIINGDGCSLNIKPDKLMGHNDELQNYPVTKGVMQVLRDAKHYYSIEFERDENKIEIGTDGLVYAYRDINDYELSKIIMTVFAHGLNKIGKLDFEAKTVYGTEDGGSGILSFTHKSFLNLGTDYEYTISNYEPLLTCVNNNKARIISINTSAAKCSRDQAGIGGYPKTFDSITITAQKTDNKLPDSYSGSITFSMDSNGNTTINQKSYKGNSRKVFVPFNIHADENNYFNNPTYGWWPEE